MIVRYLASHAIALTLVSVAATACQATIIHQVSGLSSSNVAVDFEAQLSIVGDTLIVKLINQSTVHTQNPSDALSSFYFDIVNGSNVRPTLTYASATGDVYLGDKDGLDALVAASANLIAVNANDDTWQFKTMNPADTPFLGFGIGTVGNSSISPNNFNGNIVGGLSYSIYTGDVTTNNLNGAPLVKDMATFTFTGLTGFTEADIAGDVAFGLGTAPDSFLTTPEPSGMLLATLGMLSLSSGMARRRTLQAS